MLKAHRALLASISLLAAAAGPGALAAAPLAKGPGASLVFPYFEVDLDDPDGRTTLVTIGNVGEPVIAHVSVFTDWGVPVYAWDVHLAKDAIATFNLRDLLVYGNLPPSGAASPLPGCADPVYRPPLTPSSVAGMQQLLTGWRYAGNLCYSQPREDPTLATGSILVDALERCTEALPWPAYPTDMDGYFTESGTVSRREVLWGDFTLVDPSNNFAEGFEAYGLQLAQGLDGSFGGWEHPAHPRQALPGCHRMRFLQGGPFAAKTSFFVYVPPTPWADTQSCNVTFSFFDSWRFAFYDENGLAAGGASLATNAHAARLEAGELGVATASGYVELTNSWQSFIILGGITEPRTNLLLGGIEASGRFAVGFASSPCTE